MSVAFYFDHNVRFSIALGLRQRGVVLVARDDGFERADDSAVLAHSSLVPSSLGDTIKG